ncbi:MAG: iron-sulfur cluster assembly protein [Bacillota bacterium]|nr:iron-sulfur cluster assembly protein [Bacillota bacterium]
MAPSGPSLQLVEEALARVRDPELDEPLVKLGFIDGVAVDGGSVRVSFRLPTFWCAPNFAFLMASDLLAAARAVPGVARVEVELVDHAFADEINRAIATGRSFEAAFPDETEGSLEQLRVRFLRKAFVRRQGALLQALSEAGFTEKEVAAMRLSDIDRPEVRRALEHVHSELVRCLELRVPLGLPTEPSQPLFCTPAGEPWERGAGLEPARPEAGLDGGRAWARVLETSASLNAAWCTSLLRTRYGPAAAPLDSSGASGT